MEFIINVDATGDFTEEQLKEYLIFCIGFGSCSEENPFIDESKQAELTDVYFL